MQAVILAAGEGKRMRPLTLDRPKPLISVAGKPIIEHIINALPSAIHEVIIVIGYKAEMVRDYLGEDFNGRHVTYVEQREPLGTAHALLLVRPHLSGKFLLLCGDDIQGTAALEEAITHELAILAATHPEPSKFGVIEKRADGMLGSIIEKPLAPKSNLVSTGGLVLDERIFDYQPTRHENGEYYITNQLAELARDESIYIIEQSLWIPVGYPEDLPAAEALLRKS